MRLLKLRVEEGFLDGLSLDFDPGLNVLIGPRGAGKTSIIELVRFCLGAEAYTPANDRAARDHALSILKGGQATLTVEVAGATHELARSAEDDIPAMPPEAGAPPIILSQNEIEKVGLDARGRIRLIDDFCGDDHAAAVDEGRLQAEIASLTQKIESEADAVSRLQEEISALDSVSGDLVSAEKEQDERLQGFSELEPQRAELASIDADLARLGDHRDALSQANENLSEFLQGVAELLVAAEDLIPEWPGATTGDELAPVRSRTASIGDRLRAVLEDLEDARREVTKKSETAAAEQKTLRSRARSLRSRLEEVQAGAGEVSRRVTELREKFGNRELAEKKLKASIKGLKKQQKNRKALLARLDELRNGRFQGRRDIADTLNKALGPQVKLTVSRYGILDEYAAAIAEALQGSRLRYNTLAPQIAERMTPSELVETVEQGRAAVIAKAVKIPVDRAEKVVDVIRESGSERILRAEIEDAVEIALLDGPDYKASPVLSTGQRCTAVLPILLSHSNRVLVMDQPEDHLDNAYVAETVVRTLRNAPPDSQLVISTHNANIPVLGDADRVIHLESDGQRGFIRSNASLDDSETVSAITRVMEGGEEAFQMRARFYREHDAEG
jgi:DNA repair ATPase RecN